MQNKKLKLSVVLLLLGITGLQAQTMYVNQSNGLQTDYELSSIQKITFSDGNATIQKTDNSTDVYALSGLRYLNFTSLTGIESHPIRLNSDNIIAYPNPVSDMLNIDLTETAGKGTLCIFSLEGKLMKEINTQGENLVSITVSQLPKGTYLCRCVSEKEIKTVKIIKQ